MLAAGFSDHPITRYDKTEIKTATVAFILRTGNDALAHGRVSILTSL